ncbi:S-layer homology domain-containing protein [Paenibacillus sp. PL2-23]|uniref:S-layer homology domain-containing protein n=1 Tax=Paenibacillus sp. PL2-23 TaxID=2100729 RepID=UPI0030F6A6F3
MRRGYAAFIMLLAAALIVSPMAMKPLQAAEATDMGMYFPIDIEGHWAYEELDNFVMADLLKGYLDASGQVAVRPDHPITRAEFVALLVRVLGLTGVHSGKSFTDVQADKWYNEPIRIASSLGIVNGQNEYEFGPNKLIERGDIATMIMRAFQGTLTYVPYTNKLPFHDVPPYYASPYILEAYNAVIVNGITEQSFKPFANAKRSEAIVMLKRALDAQQTDMPNGELLKSVITASDTLEYNAINGQELGSLTEGYSKHYTAFQLAANQAYGEVLQAIADEGYAMSMEETSPRNMNVVMSTNRFAIVESFGGAARFTYSIDGEESVDTQSNDGLYYLKKVEDGTWKIYAVYQ